MDLTSKVKHLVNALRGGKNPDNEKLKPIEQRRRGYQLYVQENQQLGSPSMTYEEWIKTQS